MKRKLRHLKPLWGLLFCSIFVFSACLKEENPLLLNSGDSTIVLPIPYGKIPYDVVAEEIQDSLLAHDFIINEGINPPMINGSYLISPMIIKYASDNYQNAFYDLAFQFAGQHPRGRLMYNEKQNNEAFGTARNASVIGHDSSFTVYCVQTIVNTTGPHNDTLYWCNTATIISGKICDSGIVDCQYAYVLNDKYASSEEIDNRLPEKGTYRMWQDGDGFAVKTSSLSAKNKAK